MFVHILVDATFTYLILVNKNTQVSTNKIHWVDMITGKKDCMSFLSKWMDFGTNVFATCYTKCL